MTGEKFCCIIYSVLSSAGVQPCSERKSVMDSDGLAGSIVILALILLKTFLAVCENAAAEIGDSKLKTFENGNAAAKRL